LASPHPGKHFQVSGFKMNPGYNKNQAIIFSLSSSFPEDKAPGSREKAKTKYFPFGLVLMYTRISC
jgi:hypothetical protein